MPALNMDAGALLVEARFPTSAQPQAIAKAIVEVNEASWNEIKAQTRGSRPTDTDEIDASARFSIEGRLPELREAFCIADLNYESVSEFLGGHPNSEDRELSILWYALPRPRERASRVAVILRKAGGDDVAASTLNETGLPTRIDL